MCTVSMITDHYRERWYPMVPQVPTFPFQPQIAPNTTITIAAQISADEVAEFRRLLERAREYDKLHGEPACEMEEKKTALKAIARALGVDISFIDEPTPLADAVDPSAANPGTLTPRAV